MKSPRYFIVLWKDLDKWILPKHLLSTAHLPEGWSYVRIGDIVRQISDRVKVEAEKEYKMVGVKWYGEGTFHRETVQGSSLSATYVTPLLSDTLIYNRLFAWKGSFAVVPDVHSDCFVSNEFPQFETDKRRILPRYLYLFLMCDSTINAVNKASSGSAAVSRNRFKEEYFLDFEMPLPPLPIQEAIVAHWQQAREQIAQLKNNVEKIEACMFTEFRSVIGRPITDFRSQPKAFALQWKDVERWGVEISWRKHTGTNESKYQMQPLGQLCRISSGGTPSRKVPLFFGGGIPWVKTTEVRNNIITQTEETLTATGLENSSAKIYPTGSIIIAMYGQGATRGRTAKLGISAATNQACAILSDIDKQIEPDYLWFFLMSEYEQLRELASGNNQPNLNSSMISNYLLPIPPRDVQKELIQKVMETRSQIQYARNAALMQSQNIKSEIEAMILGTKAVGNV